jgi:hypothetical protein
MKGGFGGYDGGGMGMMPQPGGPRGTRPKPQTTTLMLRNIPNALTPENLMAIVDMAGFSGTYDYLYLPRDTNTAYNKGYAFLNFMDPRVSQDFAAQLEGSAWNEKSPKRLAITDALCQGVAANLRRLRSSSTGMQTAAAFSPWLRSNQGYMLCVPAAEAARYIDQNGQLNVPGNAGSMVNMPPMNQGQIPGGPGPNMGGPGPQGPPGMPPSGNPGGPPGPTGPPPGSARPPPGGMPPQPFETGASAPFSGLGDAPRPGPWTPLGYPSAGGQ